MGIVRFHTFLNKYEKFDFNSKLENVSSLFIDCNGIFHKGKGEVYKLARDSKGYIYSEKERERVAKQDPKTLEKKHIKYIIDEIENILRKIRPTSTLILAPDGMAPVAKMQQQKERRYGNNLEEDKIFMGASISPGTEFMFNLDVGLRKWLSKENDLLPKKVIYSSHLVPGEGEHKIFDFIRNRSLETSYGNHVVYGADGDLFVISLFSKMKNIYLYHEDREKYFDIGKLKRLISDDMDYKGNNNRAINTQLVRDFCFLTFLIGNDFIHRMPNLYDTKLSMEILIECYKKNKKNLTNLEHEIEWNNFLEFLKILRDYKINDMSLYEFSIFSSFTSLHNDKWVPYPEMLESRKIYNLEREELEDVTYDPKLHTFSFDLKKFAKLWYDKQFKPQNIRLRELYPDNKYYSSKDIEKMCKYYLKILQWALYYYNMGDTKINNMLFYPFNYTPLIENLINYLTYNLSIENHSLGKNILTSNKINLTPVHQLMLILPPSNKILIPSPFRELYTEKLASISPEKFITVDKEGIDVDFKKVKLIPPINAFLVNKVIEMSQEKIPEKYDTARVLIIRKQNKDLKINQDLKISMEELI